MQWWRYRVMSDSNLGKRADRGDLTAMEELVRRAGKDAEEAEEGLASARADTMTMMETGRYPLRGGSGEGLIALPVVWVLKLVMKPLLKALEWRPVQIAIGLFLLYELVPLVRSSISAMSHGHANVLNFFLLWLVGMSLAMGLVRIASKRLYEFMNRHPSLILILVGGPVALMVFALMPLPPPARPAVAGALPATAPTRKVRVKHRAAKKVNPVSHAPGAAEDSGSQAPPPTPSPDKGPQEQ